MGGLDEPEFVYNELEENGMAGSEMTFPSGSAYPFDLRKATAEDVPALLGISRKAWLHANYVLAP